MDIENCQNYIPLYNNYFQLNDNNYNSINLNNKFKLENIKEKMIQATSSQTVRSKSRTGKHSRQLQSAWTDAWESKDAPEPLPMPLQTIVGEPALAIVSKQATLGHEGAKKLDTYWVGQGIGLVNETISAGQTVQKFKEEFIEAYERITGLIE